MAKKSPSVGFHGFVASMWITPPGTCVCRLEATPGPRPIPAGTGTSRPSAYTWSCAWWWNFSVPGAGTPKRFIRSCRWSYWGFHGAFVSTMPGPSITGAELFDLESPHPAAETASASRAMRGRKRRTGAHPSKHTFRLSKIKRMPSVDEVEEALTNVIDPELGLDFVELGLVYEIEVDGGEVNITFTLTSPGCPIGPQVSDQMKEFVGELDGVENVTPNMTFSPPWTPDLMSEDAKFALGY